MPEQDSVPCSVKVAVTPLHQDRPLLEVRILPRPLAERILYSCAALSCAELSFYTLVLELGRIFPLFFSVLPSNGHPGKRLLLAVQQLVVLRCGRAGR